MKDRKLIKRLRSELDMSQTELAAMLGCSRSAINMAERGERALPQAAFQRMILLMQAVQTSHEAGTEGEGHQGVEHEVATYSEDFLQRQKQSVRWQIQQLERKRAAAKADFDRICRAEQQLRSCLIPGSDPWQQHMQQGIELQLKQCIEKKAKYDPELQFQLEMKIAGLRAQLQWIEGKDQVGS